MTPQLKVSPRGELRIERTIVIRRGAQDVFDRVSDFRWASQWRTGVRVSTQQPSGPMVVGSRLHEEASVIGRRVVAESLRWSAPRMIARSLETLRSRLEVVG